MQKRRFALCFTLLLGCGGTPEAVTADAVARAVEASGLAVARWQVAHAGCRLEACVDAGDACEDAIAACVEQTVAQHEAWWHSWDVAAAVYDAYATALENGTPGPTWAAVLAAYCAAASATPEAAGVPVLSAACPSAPAETP